MFTPSEDELHRRSRRSTLLSQHELAFSIAFYATGGPIQWVNGCFRAWRVEQAKSPGAPWSGRSIVVVWLNPFGGPSAAECRRGGVPWGWANRRGNDWVGMFEAQGEDAVVTGEVGASRTGSVPPIRSYSGSRPVSSRAGSPVYCAPSGGFPGTPTASLAHGPAQPNVLRAPSCSCDCRAPSCDRHRCPAIRPRHDHGYPRPGLSGDKGTLMSDDPRHRVGIESASLPCHPATP